MSMDRETGTCKHESYITHADAARECLDCGECEERESPLDEPQDIDMELLDYWSTHSELFPTPDCFAIGHIAEDIE